MANKLGKILIALMIFAAAGMQLGAKPAAAQSSSGFYPVVKPNSYFIIAGGAVRFRGTGFAPNEHVDIAANGLAQTVQANVFGNFTTAPIPVGYGGGDQTFVFTGQDSN